MKSFKLLFTLAALLLAGLPRPVQAQRVEWAQNLRIGGSYTTNSVTSPSGSTYLSGIYNDSIVTSLGTLYAPLLNQGTQNLGGFLAKLDRAGQVKWIVPADGPTDAVSLGWITLDGTGHLYVTGGNSSVGRIGNLPLTKFGAFLARLDTTGHVQWTNYLRQHARPGSFAPWQAQHDYSIAGDPQGNCLLVGRATYLDSLAGFALDTTGQETAFIAKCSATGQVQWLRQLTNPVNPRIDPNLSLTTLGVDTAGNCTVSGFLKGTVTFGPAPGGPTLVNNGPVRNILLARYGPTGNLIWYKQGEGELPRALCVTPTATYLVGITPRPVVIDGVNLTSAGGYIVQLNAAGVAQWGRMYSTADFQRVSPTKSGGHA
jgi:hypothetical protein